MKKINNNSRFRNNNGNSIYSLNYKFDSVSSAGKFTGTALDLIKRYNELAKEAQSRGDYVDMEVFRQYAEHYRKIVTEINTRKNQMKETNQQNLPETEAQPATEDSMPETSGDNNLVETQAAPREQQEADLTVQKEKTTRVRRLKRGFTVVEVTKADESREEGANENLENPTLSTDNNEEPKIRKRRIISRKTSKPNEATVAAVSEEMC